MRRYFKNRKLQKHVKHYVDPNAIRDDKDDATSYLKDIAGLATILGVGATGGALLPNGRVYAAQTSVDPKSQVVGSVSDFIKSGASDTTGSKSDSKTFSISASEDKTKSTSASKSTQLSQSLSKSLSQSISQSESLSHSLSESESALNSLSLAKSKEKEAKSNKQATSTSHKSDSKASQSETANVKKSGQNNRRSAENSLSNNSTSANQEQSSTYASTSNDITTNLQASLNLSNDLSSLSNLPLAFNSVSSNNSTSNNSNSQLPVALAANFMTLAATNDAVVKPTFSGTVWIDANGKSYSGTNVPTYTFRLSTWGDSTVKNPKFILMIPAGFTATKDDISIDKSLNVTDIQLLGNYGPSGEQLYEITLPDNPPYYASTNNHVRLTLNPQAKGQYTYTDKTVPLISEISDYANDTPDNPGSGTYSFKVGNKTIEVVKSVYTINQAYCDDANSKISYAVNQALKPTFTGTASVGTLDSNGNFVSIRNINYTTSTPSDQIPSLYVRLSTSGASTVNNPQFIVTIPKGFHATRNNLITGDNIGKYFGGDKNFNGTNSNSDYTVTSLGTNSEGAETYLVKLNFNPSESNNQDLGLQFKLAVDPSVKDSYDYSQESVPLVSELASDALSSDSSQGITSITINGQVYEVVKNNSNPAIKYAVNDLHIAPFTGQSVLGYINSSGQFVSGSGKTYTANTPQNELPKLAFRLSTNGNSNVPTQRFYVIIPKGFTTSKSDFSLISSQETGKYFNGQFWGNNNFKPDQYSVTSLGNIGPKGAQVFQIDLNFNPYWSDNATFGGQFKLTLDSNESGAHIYNGSDNPPLVSENAEDATASATNKPDYTLTIDGKSTKVVKSSYDASPINYALNTTVLPQFTGKAVFGNLNSSNQFVSGNGINYTSTSTNIPTLSVQLSTYGPSTVNDPTFYVIIPKGFTSSINDFSVITKDPSNYFGGGNYFSGNPQNHLNDYSIKSLGNIGPKGEQVFQIKLTYNPKWEDNFAGQFKLKLDPSQADYYNYGSSDNPVVAELSSDTQSPSTGTLTIDGQTVKITASSNTSINYGIDTTAIPEFTGTANFDANGKIFNVGDTIPEYKFRLSTWGNSTVQNPKFIVMIPAGFTATTNDFSSIKNASIESLGTDSNGQQLFEISLKGGDTKLGNR